MLIILPSTPTTEKASDYLKENNLAHEVIPVPESIDYKTGSDLAIYTQAENKDEYPMILTKERFVVMRVFREFEL